MILADSHSQLSRVSRVSFCDIDITGSGAGRRLVEHWRVVVPVNKYWALGYRKGVRRGIGANGICWSVLVNRDGW